IPLGVVRSVAADQRTGLGGREAESPARGALQRARFAEAGELSAGGHRVGKRRAFDPAEGSVGLKTSPSQLALWHFGDPSILVVFPTPQSRPPARRISLGGVSGLRLAPIFNLRNTLFSQRV